MSIIELQNVWKSFGADRQVLRDMSINVERGESLVIVGGSGTGKSVTLKHIIGLLRPDRGRVLIDGNDITVMHDVELNRFRRRFGMAFQEGALFDSMSVFENIAFPLRRHTRMTEDEIRARVEECLDDVHLHGVDNKRPSDLSGGQRRRVGFARAISLKPEILLFDEPTTGLDPVISDVVAELIRGDGRKTRHDHSDDHPRHERRLQNRRPRGHALRRPHHRRRNARRLPGLAESVRAAVHRRAGGRAVDGAVDRVLSRCKLPG